MLNVDTVINYNDTSNIIIFSLLNIFNNSLLQTFDNNSYVFKMHIYIILLLENRKYTLKDKTHFTDPAIC